MVFCKKNELFLGVNLDLTVQKKVKDFYIFSIFWHGPIKYLSNKKKQSFLSFPWPEISGHKGAKFFDARVILYAPTV